MNDERTIYDDDIRKNQSQPQDVNKASETIQETKEGNEEPVATADVDNKPVPNKKPLWKRVAIGAGSGFAAGLAVTVLTSGTTQETADEPNPVNNDNTDGNATHPAWVDGEVAVASSVNDKMSFGEAFEAARAEVGPGGVFEWHGYIYNTYYENEWENMSAADRAEFGSHFSWNQHHNDDAASHQQTTVDANSDEIAATVDDHTDSDEVLVQTVDDPTDVNPDSGHEVEILGVSHDDDSGSNIAGMMIDGHEAVVLDVDGDMTFDIIGVDVNDDHQIDDTEQSDISDAGIAVAGFDEQQAVIALDQADLDVSVDA